MSLCACSIAPSRRTEVLAFRKTRFLRPHGLTFEACAWPTARMRSMRKRSPNWSCENGSEPNLIPRADLRRVNFMPAVILETALSLKYLVGQECAASDWFLVT